MDSLYSTFFSGDSNIYNKKVGDGLFAPHLYNLGFSYFEYNSAIYLAFFHLVKYGINIL
ncbi:hypothetical protein JN11_03376 [Mucilaginibacter frigoritolerans]|jgi:hypothetical protein|uniref:Uncharacterized protein n=1 Tax=Mucilaginibacter frigoritolerans TaxID=652788 RepID=A0A562TWT7_9SPHI|nr:hypothetical protein JN11_03376 [Mucilaginibacter frigoritolerans]